MAKDKFEASASLRKKADEIGVAYDETTSEVELQKALDAATPYDNPQGVEKSDRTYNPVGDSPLNSDSDSEE